MKVKIGTCGFGLSKVEYARSFSCVEVQNTFYQPPQISTLERWRQEVPSNFEFTLKAWQLITHEANSPTYRRLKREFSETEKSEAGFFKPTSIVKEAWEVTRACAAALKARTILFQCPASFTQTKENISNLEQFFSSITRGKLNFGWEPRGAWDRDVVKGICSDLKLWHVVDPFTAKTLTPRNIYFRLHGRTGWRYEYEESELRELAAMGLNRARSYVFFNNVRMTADALRFQEIVREGQE
jgi:uncharacterized protein YecE (DUF72 family)